MKRTVALLLIFSLVGISSIPLLPSGYTPGSGVVETSCPVCHMEMASMDHLTHAMTPTMRHCRIERCGHHDVGGLPHLFTPHAVSSADFDTGLIVSDVAVTDIPVLKPRLLPFPVPPPRFS